MKKRRNFLPFLPGTIIALIGGLVLLLSNVVLKDWLVIGFGVRALNLVHTIGLCIAIAGVVFMVPPIIALVRVQMRRQRQHRQQSQFINDYAEDAANPELTRKMLIKLQRDDASFDEIVAQCLGQMDRMDGLQDKQARLLKANGALYLSETEETLNRVEQRICRNVRNIINLCIAAGSARQLSSTKVDRILSDNESKLSDASELIRVSVDRINQYILERNDDSSEVKRWIETIRESLKED